MQEPAFVAKNNQLTNFIILSINKEQEFFTRKRKKLTSTVSCC